MLLPNDRVVMVSGVSRGIGRAIAMRLHADGYRLSLGARDPDSVADELRGDKGRVLVHPYDALDAASADAWIAATVDRFGAIDAMVNNAAVLLRGTIETATEANLDMIWAVNVKGPFLLTQKAFPHLKSCGTGRIVNIASLAGKRLKGPEVVYAMSKFAVMGLCQGIRYAGWEHGIRVTAICPGPVNTDMMAGHAPVADGDMIQPYAVAGLVAHVLGLPNNASVAEIPVNCVLENMV